MSRVVPISALIYEGVIIWENQTFLLSELCLYSKVWTDRDR